MVLVNLPISSSMALIFSTKRPLEPRLTPDRTETLTGSTHFAVTVISSAAKAGIKRRVVRMSIRGVAVVSGDVQGKKKLVRVAGLTRGEEVDSDPQIDWGSTTNET